MHNYHQPTVSGLYPELASRRMFLTAYKPTTALMLLDPDDVGKFAAAAILDPLAYDKHEIDLGSESLTPAEIVEELSRVSGKDIALEFYSKEEAERLAEKNPGLHTQLWANEVGYQVDFEALKKYPIRLAKFLDYLERQRDEVLQTYS